MFIEKIQLMLLFNAQFLYINGLAKAKYSQTDYRHLSFKLQGIFW